MLFRPEIFNFESSIFSLYLCRIINSLIKELLKEKKSQVQYDRTEINGKVRRYKNAAKLKCCNIVQNHL